MRREVTRLASALIAASCATSPEVAPTAAEQLPWLVGAWNTVESDTTTEERWVAAPDGSLLGTGRVVVRGAIIGFSETLHIGRSSGGLTLTTWVGGQDPVMFQADGITADTATFRNDTHDFPTAITYHRTSEGELEAKATGKNPDGSPREEMWTLQAGTAPKATAPTP